MRTSTPPCWPRSTTPIIRPQRTPCADATPAGVAWILKRPEVMDRWLLPTRQSDLPGCAFVADATLHGRREGTFLALVTLYLVTTLALPLFATSPVVLDLGEALRLDVALPMQLSISGLLIPLSIVAAQLTCELFGARRAGALVGVGALASVALVATQMIANDRDGVV